MNKECMKDRGVRSRADHEGEGGRERAGGRSKHQKSFQNMHVHRYTYISIQQPLQSCRNMLQPLNK